MLTAFDKTKMGLAHIRTGALLDLTLRPVQTLTFDTRVWKLVPVGLDEAQLLTLAQTPAWGDGEVGAARRAATVAGWQSMLDNLAVVDADMSQYTLVFLKPLPDIGGPFSQRALIEAMHEAFKAMGDIPDSPAREHQTVTFDTRRHRLVTARPLDDMLLAFARQSQWVMDARGNFVGREAVKRGVEALLAQLPAVPADAGLRLRLVPQAEDAAAD